MSSRTDGSSAPASGGAASPTHEAYRPAFLAAAALAVIEVALWAAWLEAARQGVAPQLAWQLPPAWVHAHALVWGVLLLYVMGFLGTALPRWLDATRPTRARVLAGVAGLVTAQAVWLTAALGTRPWALVAGGIEAAVLLGMLAEVRRMLRESASPRRTQPRLVACALGMALVAAVTDALGLARNDLGLHRAGILLGLEGFLVPLVFVVAQRIFPFFTARRFGLDHAPRPPRVAALVLAGALALTAASLLAAPRAVEGALAAALAIGIGVELSRWRPAAALREPMLAILYAGVGWIALAHALWAGLAFAGELPRLELAVRHALAVGGFGSLVLGVSTRVALGHAGRPVRADAALVASFVLVQIAALIRMAAPLALRIDPGLPPFAHWAGLPWALAFGLWLVRLGPLLVRAR